MKRFIYLVFIAIALTGCFNAPGTIKNRGTLKLNNTYNQQSIVDYTCRDCNTYFNTDSTAFELVLANLQEELLKNIHLPVPYTFKHVDFQIKQLDTVYHCISNAVFLNIFSVEANILYSYISPTGEQIDATYPFKALYQKQGKQWVLMPDLRDNMRLEPLSLNSSGDYNRGLVLNKGIKQLTFIPKKNGGFCIQTTKTCVGPGSIFKVIFEDGSEFIKLSTNSANCDGESCYEPFSDIERDFLMHKLIKRIFFHSRTQSIMFDIPNNENDFFIQYFKLNP